METMELLKPNERIILNLHSNRKIECDVVSSNKTQIKIINSIDLVTKKKRNNEQTFISSEIKSVQRIIQDISDTNSTNEMSSSASIKKKIFSERETEQINWLIETAVCIIGRDDVYYGAIKAIKYEQCIGLRFEDQTKLDSNGQSLLALCTTEKVYLFDILQMKQLFPELKEILQSKSPQKIVFDSSAICDYLWQIEKCKLNGFSDLMILHSLVNGERIITFEQCLAEYFNVPESMGSNPSFGYSQRPLADDTKRLAAFNVVHIWKLYWHLVHDKLLNSISVNSRTFSESLVNIKNPVDLNTHLQTAQSRKVNNINLHSLDNFRKSCSILKIE